MIAYKGFNHDLTSIMGDHKDENCIFTPGETKEVPASKTARDGFHCCENITDCMTYYDWDGKNRFFRVAADGDIDEDDQNRIACTKITLIEELDQKGVCFAIMKYITQHPQRNDWKCSRHNIEVSNDSASVDTHIGIAVARGEYPIVRGCAGSVVGILVEDENGIIIDAHMAVVSGDQSGKWLRYHHGWEAVNEPEGN